MNNFEVFSRTWWKYNDKWPNGLEPCMGRSTHICFTETAEQAREQCRLWHIYHGKWTRRDLELKRKAEFRAI